jgi:hypothetical protein
MPITELVMLLLCGGLLGTLGQGVRMVVGLKKLRDSKGQGVAGPAEPFSSQRLVLSLCLGFVAGALTVLTVPDAKAALETVGQFRHFALTVVAAGYAGTDFIEGVFNRFLAGLGSSSSVTSSAAAAVSPVTANR